MLLQRVGQNRVDSIVDEGESVEDDNIDTL